MRPGVALYKGGKMIILDIECEVYKFTGSYSGGMLFVPLFQFKWKQLKDKLAPRKCLYGQLPVEIDGLGRKHLLFDSSQVKYLGTYKIDNRLLLGLKHYIDKIKLKDNSDLVLLYYEERHDG